MLFIILGVLITFLLLFLFFACNISGKLSRLEEYIEMEIDEEI